jgi:hypothetical protein
LYAHTNERTRQTLVLQDRAWDETNTRIFPKTTQLLKDIGVRTRLDLSCFSHVYLLIGIGPLSHPSNQLPAYPPSTHQPNQTQQAPTVEVFFAKQGGKTGIQPHSDGCNFVLTAVRTVACVWLCMCTWRARMTVFLTTYNLSNIHQPLSSTHHHQYSKFPTNHLTTIPY